MSHELEGKSIEEIGAWLERSLELHVERVINSYVGEEATEELVDGLRLKLIEGLEELTEQLEPTLTEKEKPVKKYKTEGEARLRGVELCPGPEWTVNVWKNVEWRICWSADPVYVYESVANPGKFYAVVSNDLNDPGSGGPWTTTRNDSDSVEEAAVTEIAAFLEYTRKKRSHWDEIQTAIEKSGIKTVIPPKKAAV